MEEFDEGTEFVVQGYLFELLINVNQTVEYSSADVLIKTVNDQYSWFHVTLTSKICLKIV